MKMNKEEVTEFYSEASTQRDRERQTSDKHLQLPETKSASYSITIQLQKDLHVVCQVPFSLSASLSLTDTHALTHAHGGMVFPSSRRDSAETLSVLSCGFLLEIHPSFITMALIHNIHTNTHTHTHLHSAPLSQYNLNVTASAAKVISF